MRGRRILAEDLQRLDAADAGQVDVHQDHLRLAGAGELDAHVSVQRAEQPHGGAPCDQLLDQLEIGGVVLDVEQGPQRGAVLRLRLDPGFGLAGVRFELRRVGGAELEPEDAAHSDAALHADHASHQLDQPLAHHQADTGSLHRAAPLAEAVEGLEQLRQFLRREPRAGVRDAEADPIEAAGGARHHHRPSGLVVLDRVGEEVDQHLLQPGAIGEDEARRLEDRERHPDAALERLRLDHRLAFEDHLGHRGRLLRERELS